MRFGDIISMCVSNLWKRKVRTILTVLGVMIGTASIVVMLSLGIGLKQAMLAEMTSGGGMTDITVSSAESWGDKSAKPLVDDQVELFSQMEHVTGVTPMLEFSPSFYVGQYHTDWVGLRAVPHEFFENLELAEGSRIPAKGSGKLEVIVGNNVPMMLANKKDETYWDTNVMPEVDFMTANMFLQMPSTYTTGPDGEDIEQPAKKELLDVTGVLEGTADGNYSENGMSILVDMDTMKKYLNKEYRGKTIPGQPLDKTGKPFRELHYTSVIVSVDNMDNVDAVMKDLRDEGFQAESEAEWIKEAQKEMLIIEAVLGGIGAISLLVAAIGIANTMMMSTYERTKEIGIMKVLGCSISNIRGMFLTEAAFIGLLGGIVGIVISFLLSFLCNLILPTALGYEGQNISVIPFWLVVVATIFSTLVGMLAGFFPAQRATKLSPLAAIRNE